MSSDRKFIPFFLKFFETTIAIVEPLLDLIASNGSLVLCGDSIKCRVLLYFFEIRLQTQIFLKEIKLEIRFLSKAHRKPLRFFLPCYPKITFAP
jgi:hypothetical protein